ncbi:hypothetical protein HD806DRAFT_494008 [Xylariaceae sp. AK1471]|nr:hypothetical protein HD806DRAFT_494008 [Xylariaceae sp. AK1471]
MAMEALLNAAISNEADDGRALAAKDSQRKGFTSDDILRLLVYSPLENKSFVPNGVLEELITLETVTSTLAAVGLSAGEQLCFARFIVEKGRRIFAILLFINQVNDIKSLFSEGFTDEALPVAYQAEGDSWTVRSYLPDSDNLDQDKVWVFFQHWKKSAIFSFCERQWMFLAPVFRIEKFKHFLHRDAILPFVSVKGETKNSYFSVVFHVEIHAAHLERLEPTIERPFDCAIKELAASDSDNTFDKESNALAYMREIDHKHLIKCIAAVQKERRYFFVFPWADGGNLREFWGSDDFASPDTQTTSWAISQMRGLAEALTALHNYNTRHGDLKPENILRFSDDSSSGYGRLVIADVGLAKVHTDMTRSRQFPTRTVTGTVRYEAPEAFSPDQSRSRLYDLWAMGCIILEFVTWILHGREELRKFNSSFESYAHATQEGISPLDQVAQSWMEFMLRDPRCARNTALGEVLNFIKQRLLVPIKSEGISPLRASAKDLCDYLNEVCYRSTHDPAYLFDPKLWKNRERRNLLFHSPTQEASLLMPPIKSRDLELPLQMNDYRRPTSLPQLVTRTRGAILSGENLEKTLQKPATAGASISVAAGPSENSCTVLPKISVSGPVTERPQEESPQDQQDDDPDCDTETEVDNQSIRSTSYELSSSESSWSGTSGYGYDSTSSLSEDVVEATSQENHVLEFLVKYKKEDLADKTMSWFSSKLDSGLTLMAYQQGETSAAGGAIQGSDKPTEGNNAESQAHKKRKGVGEDNRGHGNDGGDGNDDRKGKGKKKPRTSANHSRKLACPFFKHNPDLYGKNMTCRGHSWDTVHRIKEHLFRTHTQPEGRCHRCLVVFENVPDLQQHQRKAVPCDVIENAVGETYIDAPTAQRLRRKSAKGSIPKKSEFVKWKEMFNLLFPDVEPIPSPYYDDDQEKRSEAEVIQDFSSFAAREMRQEMNSILRDSGIEDALRARLVKRFQSFQPMIQEKYLHQQRHCRAVAVELEAESPEENTRTTKPEERPHHGGHDSESEKEDDTRNEGGGAVNESPMSHQLRVNDKSVDQPLSDKPQLPELLANLLPSQDDQPRTIDWGFGNEGFWDIPNFTSNPNHTAPASLPSAGTYQLYNTERTSENAQNTDNNQVYHWPTHSSAQNTFGSLDTGLAVAQSSFPWDGFGQHFAAGLPDPELTPVPSSPTGKSSRGTMRPSRTFWQESTQVGISTPADQLQTPHFGHSVAIDKTHKRQHIGTSNQVQKASSGDNQPTNDQNTKPHFHDSGYLTMSRQTANPTNHAGGEILYWDVPSEGHPTL